MKRITFASFLFAALLGSALAAGTAQEPKPAIKPATPAPKQGNPAVHKPDPPAAPKPDAPAAPKKDEVSSVFADIIGDGSIKYGGSLKTEVDPKTGDLISIKIDGGVAIVGTVLNLDCETLTIDKSKQIMTAKAADGKVLHFSRTENGTKVSGTCTRLTNYMEEKKTILEGNPKIKQEAADGGVTEMAGGKIFMTQVGEATSISTEGGGEMGFKSAPKDAKKSANPEMKPAAEKIEPKNVKDIKGPAVQR